MCVCLCWCQCMLSPMRLAAITPTIHSGSYLLPSLSSSMMSSFNSIILRSWLFRCCPNSRSCTPFTWSLSPAASAAASTLSLVLDQNDEEGPVQSESHTGTQPKTYCISSCKYFPPNLRNGGRWIPNFTSSAFWFQPQQYGGEESVTERNQ